MNIKPIKTDQDHEQALARLEIIFDALPGTKEGDELEILSVLIDNYESTKEVFGYPDPIEAIKFRMEQEGLRQKDLEKYFPSKSRVSEVLNHKRPLSLGAIRALHKGLGIPASVLVQ